MEAIIIVWCIYVLRFLGPNSVTYKPCMWCAMGRTITVGTSLGKKYWTQHPHVPEEFLLAVNAGTVQSNTHVLFK